MGRERRLQLIELRSNDGQNVDCPWTVSAPPHLTIAITHDVGYKYKFEYKQQGSR
jgi:hypothetical protein